jgi:hypothetical protein
MVKDCKSKIKIGDEFGSLTVTAFHERKNGHVYWVVKCKCGNNKVVTTTNLLNGSTHSCGCISKDLFREARLPFCMGRKG